MKTSILWAFLAALFASSPAFAQKESAVLDFAEHGQIVAVETLRTPGVWEGEIIGGTFAGGWVMRIQTSAGEVMFANSGSSALQSLPLGGDRRIVHFVDELPGCGGGLIPPDHGPEQGGIAGNCDDGTVLDVLVKWTPTAEQQVGGPVAMRALTEAAVAMSNHVYIASGVNVYMRGVGFGITEPYAGDADQYVLNELATNGDGILDSVHAERDALGADLVALITGPSWYCGIAYINGANNPAAGFSVTVWFCVPGLTFTHEVGHNQGCCHALPECTVDWRFPYSKGHRFFGLNNVEYRTVMAYAPGQTIPRLSSPLVPYMGTPTGLPMADNARTVRETASVIANFRCGGPFPEALVRSPLLPGPTSDAVVSFMSSGVATARPGTQVIVVTRAMGDLANIGETVSLRIGTTDVGVVIGGSGVDCELESRITSVPAEVFNNAIGDGSSVTFGLRASANVGSCSSSEVSIELRYERATGPTCPADINRDGQISGEDLAFLLSAWGSDGQSEFDSDINDDGIVNGLDLAAVLSAWGPSCGATPPTLTSVGPRSLPSAGGALITLTGTSLIGTTAVTVGGVAATDVQVISANTVTAVAPAGSAGTKDVSITTPAGTATLPGAVAYTNVTVPSWATPLEAEPDPSVITNPASRAAIAATGFAWRVRDLATRIEMVLIPPGTFSMGCSPSAQHACAGHESPVHQVTLTRALYVGRYEVTSAEWIDAMGPHDCAVPFGSAPVRCVSWSTIQQFLSQTGLRLPTEAEWEYAYRAGTATAFHSMPGFPSGTSNDNFLGTIAWFGGNSDQTPHPVGQKVGNGFGLHDMSGNVSEWVSDWFGAYPSGAVSDPSGPESGTRRVYRGGGFYDTGNCRASHRSSQLPSGAFSDVGFRVARTAISTGSAPMLSAVSPTSGPTAGGTTITLTGTNLTGASSVTVGGTAATNVQVVNSTTVTAVTPPATIPGGSGGSFAVDVTVTTPGGTATRTGAFTYVVPAPTLTSVTPSSGPGAGGTSITLTGTNLTGILAVTVGGAAATNVQVVNSTTVTAVTPVGNVGPKDVTVVGASGIATLAGGFTYIATPTLSAVSPTSGPTTGGTTITLTGTNLTGASSVTVGGTAATNVQVVNATTVTAVTPPATIPAGSGGSFAVDVTLTTPGGTATRTGGFTYVVPAPTIVSVSPTSGPTTGGTTITVFGTNLTGAKSVTVGGAPATNIQVLDGVSLTAVTPAGTAGARDVTVTTPGGTATRTGGFTYVVPAPTLSAVSPTSGPTTGGTTITLTGTNLTGASSVTVGGTAATNVQVVNATTVTAVTPVATIPAGAGSSFAVDVTVTTPGGTATRTGGFTYVRPAPTIVSVSPTSGPTTGGTTIMVFGTNLIGATGVTVGGTAATNVQVLDGVSLTAVTPAGTAGPRDVTVTTPGGTATLAGAFTYQLAGDECSNALTAVIGANPFSTVSMTTSPDPVTESQCPGTFLGWGTANKDVWFRLVSPGNGSLLIDTCDIESFDTSVILYSGTSCSNKSQIACNGDAQGDGIAICQGFFSRIGPVAVTGGATYWIRIGGWDGGAGPATGPGTLNVQFAAAPTLSAVSPTSGPTAGGTAITLTGTNLTGASSVTVGGAAATNVVAVNATTVTAVTPAGTAGARDVTVTALGGTATLAGGFTYASATVPAWATLVQAQPTSSDVPVAVYRDAIIASGFAWRVRDTATQIEMVLIPPGTFQMGCSASAQGGCDPDETPTRQVAMTQAFYIGVYEVTQEQWTARMGSNPSIYATSPIRPVDSVSWDMVQQFLSLTGMRLPTEAEWEYAYRAGTGLAYHSSTGSSRGGDSSAYLATIGWFEGNNGTEGAPDYGTKVVGLKQRNGFGLHDMSGNVIEWVNDWYSSTYYSVGPSTNPPGPASGTTRVLRGGGWLDPANMCRSSERLFDVPSSTGFETTWNHYGFGFRVARNPQ